MSAIFSDETLALGIKRGDPNALAVLVERHHSPLLGYLYRLTDGDRALAEDLAQETFLRALRGISSYDPARPFKPWVYAIATNLARDHYKSARVGRERSLDSESAGTDGEWASAEAAPEQAALRAEESRTVQRAVADLPDHQREVVVLRFYQSLALNEIAAALDIPLGTVKSRLSLGIRRLRETLLNAPEKSKMERTTHDG
jgi:RNA polymerase sigma-70 factor (ECF subfamily)